MKAWHGLSSGVDAMGATVLRILGLWFLLKNTEIEECAFILIPSMGIWSHFVAANYDLPCAPAEAWFGQLEIVSVIV